MVLPIWAFWYCAYKSLYPKYPNTSTVSVIVSCFDAVADVAAKPATRAPAATSNVTRTRRLRRTCILFTVLLLLALADSVGGGLAARGLSSVHLLTPRPPSKLRWMPARRARRAA